MTPQKVEENVNTELAVAIAERSRLIYIRAEVSRSHQKATSKLAELKAKLPGLLVKRALSKVTDAEVKTLKEEIRELEIELPDFQPAIDGLGFLIVQNDVKLAQPRRVLKKIARYKETCEKLKEDKKNYSDVATIRSIARNLGFVAACEEFVKTLPQMQR